MEKYMFNGMGIPLNENHTINEFDKTISAFFVNEAFKNGYQSIHKLNINLKQITLVKGDTQVKITKNADDLYNLCVYQRYEKTKKGEGVQSHLGKFTNYFLNSIYQCMENVAQKKESRIDLAKIEFSVRKNGRYQPLTLSLNGKN